MSRNGSRQRSGQRNAFDSPQGKTHFPPLLVAGKVMCDVCVRQTPLSAAFDCVHFSFPLILSGGLHLGHVPGQPCLAALITSVTFRSLLFRFNLEVQPCVSRSLLSPI